MKTISKSQLKSRMLAVFRSLERSKEELIVTDYGKPVLKISPIQNNQITPNELFKPYRGKVRYYEDVTKSTISEWPEV